MRAEVVAIGSELTSGARLDTNSQWLSQRLAEVGIDVDYHSKCADEMDALVGVLRDALERVDLVLVTGGLGPTADDLTREAVAQVVGSELVLDQPSVEHIEDMFRRRNRPMPERNRVQAMLPVGGVPIPNANGTAPGIWFEQGGKVLACLPGVPSEMKGMFSDWVAPRVSQRFGGGRVIRSRTLRCFGAGESHIEELLGDLTARGRHPEVGITASEATISLRITASATTIDDADALIAKDVAFIHEQLGHYVFGEGEETLQAAVVRLLSEQGKTLATAESCTGGLVGHLLTEVPGSSVCYLGGIVAYSNAAKEAQVGVPHEMLVDHGAVSPQVATALAQGARTRFGADLGIGITGIAGPGGGTAEKPVGLVYVALAHEGGVALSKYDWAASRSSTKLRSAKVALDLTRRHLLGVLN